MVVTSNLYLIDCAIATLPQLHFFAEVPGGYSQLIVGEDSRLHIKLLKFCCTQRSLSDHQKVSRTLGTRIV